MAEKLKKHGSHIHLTDSANGKNVAFGLYGKAEQNGEPTPDNPIEITVSGSDGSVEVVSCGKNLLKNTATTQTINGVTFSVNEYGSVTANGTATADAHFKLRPTCEANALYQYNGCILSGTTGGSASTYMLTIQQKDSPWKTYGMSTNGDSVIKISDDDSTLVNFFIKIRKDVTVTNQTFYPMIRLASDTDDTFEPYTETTSTIPTPNGLCGIKVSSGGNYTDENGQQWIADEIVKYADGSGKRIQKIGKVVFNGSDDEKWTLSEMNDNTARYVIENIVSIKNETNAICNLLPFISGKNGAIGPVDYYCFAFRNELKGFTFRLSSSIQTVAQLRTYLNEKNLIVYYVLAEPIITDLTAEEIAEIEKLHTFYPITNISNDADCGMEITYISTLLEFIEPKTDWTSTDRFNYVDYNRIKNNLSWLHAKAMELWKTFEIEDMGEDILSYKERFFAYQFNRFENNLDKINQSIFTKDYGYSQIFIGNGKFITYEELNRIESAILSMRNILDNQEKGIKKLSFRLGAFKEVKI